MAWKKSKDGGIDYEVEELIEQHKREQEPFNPFATAMTMTSVFNQEEVVFDGDEKIFVHPRNAEERIHNYKVKQRKRAKANKEFTQRRGGLA